MITLEGYEIEEMRSINHIMTVELQFDKPVTQKEARDYLSRVLTKANEMEAQAEKEMCKKIFNADETVIYKEPGPEGTIFCAAPKDEELHEYLMRGPERLETLSFEFPQEKPAAVAKKPEKTEGVLKVPVTEEEIAGMKQKKLEEEAKAQKPKKIDWDKACALKKAGWSNKDIASELHANEGTISAMIYKHLEKYNTGERESKYEEKTEV